MNNKIKTIHHKIENIFYIITAIALKVIAVLFGILSWIYPVFGTWVDIIDRNFNILKSIGYVFIGICLFYIALSLENMIEKLKIPLFIGKENAGSSGT